MVVDAKYTTEELIEKANQGDIELRDYLVEKNMGLVYSVAKRFLNRGYEFDDLIQLGSIGLVKAISGFDNEYKVKFSTYAVPMIIGEIKRFLRDDGIIKVSRNLKEIAVKGKYAQNELKTILGREATINEIAKHINVDPEELVTSMEAVVPTESLQSEVYSGESNSISLQDTLVENKSMDMVDKIALMDVISRLTSREKTIIMLRYFSDKTQTQVAQSLGVSQVQVSRIEKKILAQLKCQLME